MMRSVSAPAHRPPPASATSDIVEDAAASPKTVDVFVRFAGAAGLLVALLATVINVVLLAPPPDPPSGLSAPIAEVAASIPRPQPSFRVFLSLCDGIKDFQPSPFDALSLLGIDALMTPARAMHQRVFPTLSRFQIGRGKTTEFIAFDPERLEADEPEVVWISAEGEEARHANFAEFLHGHLKALRAHLAVPKAKLMSHG